MYSMVLAVRLLLAVPVGALLVVALALLVLSLLLQLVWLLPLAFLVGLLMPSEPTTAAAPIELTGQHVVILGGGSGLSRAIALECVRRGADVTVLAAESEALTATYEMMKTTSLDRQAHVKQQLRCSPLELTDGPMACFVALQNVLELVGKIDIFICHPAELLADGKSASSPLSQQLISETVLCCVWSVRAIMFPMQRQTNGRVLVLGSAPGGTSHGERVSFKLAMQSLGRELRAELGEFGIPVSLADPLGSEDDTAGARPPAAEYACHVVSGMIAGAPYILPPVAGGGMLGTRSGSGGEGALSQLVGFGDLSPATVVLQAVWLPVLALADAGVPVAWREMLTRCFHRWPCCGAKPPLAYAKIRDDPLSA